MERRRVTSIFSNRRRKVRHEADGTVYFAGIEGKLVDLSEIGCRALFQRGIFVPDTVVELTIAVAGTEEPFTTKARVVRFDQKTGSASFEFE